MFRPVLASRKPRPGSYRPRHTVDWAEGFLGRAQLVAFRDERSARLLLRDPRSVRPSVTPGVSLLCRLRRTSGSAPLLTVQRKYVAGAPWMNFGDVLGGIQSAASRLGTASEFASRFGVGRPGLGDMPCPRTGRNLLPTGQHSRVVCVGEPGHRQHRPRQEDAHRTG